MYNLSNFSCGAIHDYYIKSVFYCICISTSCTAFMLDTCYTDFIFLFCNCAADNVGSLNFHKAVNFNEANRIICFTKRL